MATKSLRIASPLTSSLAVGVVVCLVSVLRTCAEFSGNERKLFLNLTAGYNSISRPVAHADQRVHLQFSITLNQILNLDAKHQILSSYVWIRQSWSDENLKWNPGDFHGLQKLMFTAHAIWLPDVYIFNVAGSMLEGFVNVSGTNVVVTSDGHVTWALPLRIKSACPVDATFFPYDKQSCVIHFGSWIYDISQIDISLVSDKPDLSNYVVNNEFELASASLVRAIANSTCCPGDGKHPMVHFNIKLKRKTNYYDYIVIAPTINLCVLTLATFLLPCECGWKIAIGLTVFLTLYVLQLLIAENVPDTNSTPLISVFLLLVMSLNCVSLITATIIMNIKRLSYLDPPPEVPKALLVICEKYFARLICARLADWKRIASNPEEMLSITDKETARIRLLSKLKNIQNSGNRASAHAHYVQLKEVPSHSETSTTDHHETHAFERSETAESCFSILSAESSYNEDYFQTEQTSRPKRNAHFLEKPPEQINHSFEYDSEDGTEILDFSKNNEDFYRRQSLQSMFSRDRPSYRKAIRYGHDQTPKRLPRHSHENINKLVMSSLSRKYQWYFVADTIDTITFLVYIALMFLSIFTVLVITPLFA